MRRFQILVRKLWFWIIPVTAILMLVLTLTPASVWQHPANDAVYSGFDPNLIYADQAGNSASEGIVDMSRERLTLTAIPSSQPFAHLVTTRFKRFDAQMDIRVLESTPESVPLMISIWSPRTRSGYTLEFGPTSDNSVTTRATADAIAAPNLITGKLIKEEILGTYSPGQLYHLQITLDKEAGTISSRLTGQDSPPSGTPMLRLVGGENRPQYSDICSDLVQVEEGKDYEFGGMVRAAFGSDSYKVAIEWLDRDKNHLGFTGDWRGVAELSGWTEKEFGATTPPDTAFARLLLGAGNDTQILFAHLFLREVDNSTNLLHNGDLQDGTRGWIFIDRPFDLLEIIDPTEIFLESSLSAQEATDLFESARLTLTVSASSRGGIATTVLQNYQLTLPHQNLWGIKIEDDRARALTAVLLAVGLLLCTSRVGIWIWQRRRSFAQRLVGLRADIHEISFHLSLKDGAATGSALVYLMLNSLLFSLGSHPFDMLTLKIGAYVAASYGTSALYYLPNLVSLAKVWNGLPYHEAVFPYGPTMAYIFTSIGWVQKVFLSGPTGLVADTFQMEFLIKSVNVLFGLGSGFLIYLILGQFRLSQRWRLAATGIFLFNPALLFSMSIWGTTTIISVFFLLASIWLVEKSRVTSAWLALVVACLTRPQVLIPAFFLGIFLLRKVPLKSNLRAMTWTVILTFLFLAPLSLKISPSLPVDLMTNQFLVQEGGANEPALTTVSLDAYSVWPLVTYFTKGALGQDRIFYPSTSPVLGDISFQQLSLVLTLMLVMLVAGLILFRSRSSFHRGDYLLMLVTGTIGFLVLKTGLAAVHFVLGLPLLMLCIGFARNKMIFLVFVALWTITTAATMYGSLGYAISGISYMPLSPLQQTNAVTSFFMKLFSSDLFMTIGCIANLSVFGYLVFLVIRRWRLPVTP